MRWPGSGTRSANSRSASAWTPATRTPAAKSLLDVVDRVKAITGRIDLVHANDSKDAFDSGRDRHDNFGRGQIDPKLIIEVVRAAGAPAVVETPRRRRRAPGRHRDASRRPLGALFSRWSWYLDPDERRFAAGPAIGFTVEDAAVRIVVIDLPHCIEFGRMMSRITYPHRISTVTSRSVAASTNTPSGKIGFGGLDAPISSPSNAKK